MKYIISLICTCLLVGCSKFDNAKLTECEYNNKNLAESSLYYQTKLQVQTKKNIELEFKIESEVKSRMRDQKLALANERESMINENNHSRATLRSIFGLAILGMLVGLSMINYWIMKKYLNRKPKDAKNPQ